MVGRRRAVLEKRKMRLKEVDLVDLLSGERLVQMVLRRLCLFGLYECLFVVVYLSTKR